MAGLKSLVCMAFLGSIGVTLLIIACAIPGNWWPFFVVIFYLLAPIPTFLAQRYLENNSSGSAVMEFTIFITMGLVVSAFGLPIILYRAPESIIDLTGCYLTLSANVVIFITLLGFFMVFQTDDSGGWWQI